MIKALVALSILLSGTAEAPGPPHIPPSLDLSAIRYIMCTKGHKVYTGSGFMIAPHVLATARHVSHGDKCVDVETGTVVKGYNEDTLHDFALMSAPGIPDDIPYVKYRCDGLKANQPYLSYGVTDYDQERPILRMNTLYSTRAVTGNDNAVIDFPHSKGMREFNGAIAPGMSGGPVTDINGYVVAVNNAGDTKTSLLFDIKDTVLCKK